MLLSGSFTALEEPCLGEKPRRVLSLTTKYMGSTSYLRQ